MRAGWAGLAMLLGVALCSCARVAPSAPGGTNPWTIPGVLRIGDREEPDNLNLMYGHTLATGEIDCLLFAFILRTDDNGNLFPDLATQVPTLANGGISRDGKTITIHLRRDAQWSDGAPLTAADWLFTYRAVKNPANTIKTNYGWNTIASADAPDPYTIVLHLKKPTVEALEILTMGGDAYPPLPAHLLSHLPNLNHATFNNAPISSGPFLLTHWDRGNSLTFAANPRYFRGPPKLKTIVWKVIPDSNTLLNELRTHQIDVYAGVQADSIAELRSIPGIRVVHRLVAWWQHLGMNMRKPQLADVRVRDAIAEGVDWKRIVDVVYGGHGQLAVSDIFPQSWAAPTLPGYRFDPSDARRQLAQAGWRVASDGVLHKGALAMHLVLSSPANDEQNERAELLIQSMLKQLWFDIEIRNYPARVLFAQNGPIYSGTYDLEWSRTINGADPDDAGSWDSHFLPPNGADTSWLRDPIVDANVEAAARTFDQTARKALYQKEAARIRQLNPAVFVFWYESYIGINSDVRNYRPAAFIADEWNAWQWEIGPKPSPVTHFTIEKRIEGFDPDGKARLLLVAHFFNAQNQPVVLTTSDLDWRADRGHVQWQTRMRYGTPAALVLVDTDGPIVARVHANIPAVGTVTVRADTRRWPQPRVVAAALGPHMVQIGWFPRAADPVRVVRIDANGKRATIATLPEGSSTFRDASVHPGNVYRYDVERGAKVTTLAAVTVPGSLPATNVSNVAGKGMWLYWSVNPLDDDYYAKLDPQAIVDQAAKAGLHYVELRTAYGAHWLIPPAAKPTIDAIVDGLAARGIASIGWTVPREATFEDLSASMRSIDYRTAKGTPLQGLAVDLERGDDFFGGDPNGLDGLWMYAKYLREAVGPRYLIVATVEDPSFEHLDNATYPFRRIARSASVLQPMAYWRMMTRHGVALSPAKVNAMMRRSVATLRAQVGGAIPISLGGQTTAEGPNGYPSASEIVASLDASKTAGAIGECFFDWDGTQPYQWKAIGSYRW
ncbi:MAG TPA: peptide ABC transporter substrate-binding protein [Candidatus Baltobacteraceae bacterium]|nr:peptide ABC transporter substrate-binding protein [Candidatus Baltobacteraceae bacterium]